MPAPKLHPRDLESKINIAVNRLWEHHQGKHNPMSRNLMSELLFDDDSQTSLRLTRFVMSEVSLKYPVAFSPNSKRGGYYYIVNSEELEETMRTYESYAMKFLVKRGMLNKAYYKKTGRQLSLPIDLIETIKESEVKSNG